MKSTEITDIRKYLKENRFHTYQSINNLIKTNKLDQANLAGRQSTGRLRQNHQNGKDIAPVSKELAETLMNSKRTSYFSSALNEEPGSLRPKTVLKPKPNYKNE